MGGHCGGGGRGSYYYPSSPDPELKAEPEPTPNKRMEALIKGECGLFTAFMLTRRMGEFDDDEEPEDVEDYVDNGYDTLEEFKIAFESVIDHKLKFETLIELLKNCDVKCNEQIIYQHPDLRYNSDRRHFVGRIFSERVKRGFVALKFEGNDDTHWCPIVNGRIGILDAGDEQWLSDVGAIRSIAPTFDGFTQCAMYLSELDRLEIENIYSEPCAAQHCSLCFRRGFCKEGHKGMSELADVANLKIMMDV